MARYLYSSFHYDDVWRANAVRNSGTLTSVADEVGFYDGSLWETAKTQGAAEIQRLIDDGMSGAGVTVVLVGSETYSRPWVIYEIEKSYLDGMGMFAVHVNSIADQNQNTKSQGPNPFDFVTVSSGFFGASTLAGQYPIYDWTYDDGYNNVGNWVESAAIAAGR